ncbi:uncharacterized protein LOC18022819 [Eutrema salsugineum]|uniref:uncharacterized protein LOC18022819 n=1 Tax=Eutrema salsugineum TaxID=72664 RepID=UPI000CED4BE9|nr:uncharacterized protein LOC18022819 [Eutrema salsugineum]
MDYSSSDHNTSNFLKEDIDLICSQIEDQKERINLKRRFLLGLDMPKSENHTEFKECAFLPESLLRKDDIIYETLKSRVEEAFGFRKEGDVSNSVQQKETELSTKDVVAKLDMFLDSLTNIGLRHVATIVTGGSTTSFEETPAKMKKVIKEWIKSGYRKRKHDTGNADIVRQVSQVLSDLRNYREDCRMDPAPPTFQSHVDAVMKTLNELEQLSTQALKAMTRKLEGSREIPRLGTSYRHLKRSDLIKKVRKASEKMLSGLYAGDKLPEPLAKAMSLVDLSLKLSSGYKTAAATEFWHFSPETKNLQEEIVKAVWLIGYDDKDKDVEVVKIEELERMCLILDQEHKLSKRKLRSAVKKLLTEYLFECGDMDIIPQSLKEALSLVNDVKRDVLCPREAVEEEIESILNVSAQLKQIFWECSPDYELDQDFGNAYMEELEDSEEDDDDTQDDAMDSTCADDKEGGAECSVFDLGASSYTVNQRRISTSVVVRDLAESSARVQPRSLSVTPTSNKSTSISYGHDIGTSKRDVQSSARSLYSVENIQSDDDAEHSTLKRNRKNQYLAVQKICDDTSLFAYNLIGRVVEKIADREGIELKADQRSYLAGKSRLQENVEVSEQNQASSSHGRSDESIFVSAVKELMPSLDESVLLKLKELMEGSKDQQS